MSRTYCHLEISILEMKNDDKNKLIFCETIKNMLIFGGDPLTLPRYLRGINDNKKYVNIWGDPLTLPRYLRGLNDNKKYVNIWGDSYHTGTH